MVFTQATTYVLTKRLTGRDDAAILAALAFTFSGYALAHWGHPQLQLMGMLPLGFLLLFRLLDAPTTRNAVLFGVVAAAIALGALYYGVVFAVCAGVVLLGHLWSQRYRLKPGFWRGIAISVAVAGVLVAPFAVGYARLQSQPGFDRPSVPAWGLKAADLFTPAPRSYLYDWMARIGPERDGEHMHFLGFSCCSSLPSGWWSRSVVARGSHGATTCRTARSRSRLAAIASCGSSCSQEPLRWCWRSAPRSTA